MRLPELDQVAMFKAKLASFLPNMAKVTSSQTRMFPGFSGNMAISLSQAAQCLGTQVTLWGGGYGRACADSQRTSAPCAWALKSRSWSPVGTAQDRPRRQPRPPLWGGGVF